MQIEGFIIKLIAEKNVHKLVARRRRTFSSNLKTLTKECKSFEKSIHAVPEGSSQEINTVGIMFMWTNYKSSLRINLCSYTWKTGITQIQPINKRTAYGNESIRVQITTLYERIYCCLILTREDLKNVTNLVFNSLKIQRKEKWRFMYSYQ